MSDTRRQDRKIFADWMRALRAGVPGQGPAGEVFLEAARFFLGAPYAAGTLEGSGPERLVVNLRSFDCFTLVECALAAAGLSVKKAASFDEFRKRLEKIRYRGGRLEGYPSRLHYFTDWVRDNSKKGIVRDITRRLGGRACRGKIDFMTRQPQRYPKLRDGRVFRRIRAGERRIGARARYVIPKAEVRAAEKGIRDGDIVAITTAAAGMDIRHVGLALRVRGRVRLLHASSARGRVVLSRQTLYRYLLESGDRTGITVARPL